MSQRLFLAAFDDERDVLAVTRLARRRGVEIQDVYAPYPVHGLPEAMGLAPSRLGWACFACGGVGAIIAMLGQYYLSAISWPLNVGGKPWNSTLAFIPVGFELTVLFAGLGVVAALLVRRRLWPGKTPRFPDPSAVDDRFVLMLVEQDASFDAQRWADVCRAHHAAWTEERIEGQRLVDDHTNGRPAKEAVR
jgi:hypothetical protein